MLIFQHYLPHEYQAGTLYPEPFVNYILEGSVSMSTCKSEVAAEAITDTPKFTLELELSLQ